MTPPIRKNSARVLVAAIAASLALAGCTTVRERLERNAVHEVRPGETLAWIAASYGVGVERLAAENRLRDVDRIEVGRRLVIPDRARLVHTVARGETLSGIAARYRVPKSTIAYVNRIRLTERIQPGRRLRLPPEAVLPPRPAEFAAPAPERVAPRDPPPARAASAPPKTARRDPTSRAVRAETPTARAETRVAGAEPVAPRDPRIERATLLVERAISAYRDARFEVALERAQEAQALLGRSSRTGKLRARAAFVAASALAGMGEEQRAVDEFARVRALDPKFEPPEGWLSPRLATLYGEARSER